MRRLTRSAVLGPALFIGMTLAALPAQAAAPASTTAETITAIPYPPREDPFWWPRSVYQERFGSYDEMYDRRALVLTISSGDGLWQRERRVHLSCSPYRPGSHPHGFAACQQLERAGGVPSRVQASRGTFCTREYDPVTVTARGLWDGRLIRYQNTFSNPCLLRAATGMVYRF